MPFIPHTDEDIKEMLTTIGANSITDFFDEIPEHLRAKQLAIPEGLTEMEIAKLMEERARMDNTSKCFIGAGAYEHFIPAAVWELTGRGEFLTAYTPYQAEASQGTLQLLYEYQTMMASLMGLDVSNASLYDGATALAEAVLMAVRCQKQNSKRILIPGNIHPHYREVVATIVRHQNIELIDVPYEPQTGQISLTTLQNYEGQEIAALIIAQPNFFGGLEEVDQLTDWAHRQNALVIAQVNPIATALLKEPGQWGETGADIACGEGQPLGIPLASGGPYFGFLCSKMNFVRQMPGRIIGQTVDSEGKRGFALTLQAREQHIRRAKATSNICTNQGLLVTAATIYMSLVGFQGLQKVASASITNTLKLQKALTAIPQVEMVFKHHFFHEFAIRIQKPVDGIISAMAQKGIQAGYNLSEHFPELGHALLICVTETKTEHDLHHYVETFKSVLNG